VSEVPGVEPDRDALREEVVELVRGLIRIDTSNPPGGETAAAEYLASYLGEAGVECELCGPDPQRLNLIARLPGRGTGPSLLLMAHTDVVPAPAENWTVDPFEGAVRDGRIVGRGAADMKGELGSRATALAALAREGFRPAGDIVFVAESDEERNQSDVGMSWIARERPDARCDYAINEGGGTLLRLADGRCAVTVSVGEKLVTSLRIRIFGTAGHASVPEGADNALVHMASAIEALSSARRPPEVGPVLRRALEALGAPEGDDEAAIECARKLHPALAAQLPAMAGMTITPTGAQSYEPSNVIPPYVDLVCDCRALPGQDEADVRERIAETLGEGYRYEVEFRESLAGGTESGIETPLFAAIESFVEQRVPGALLLPLINPGFTDSHWVRLRHGTHAYGFAPVFEMDPDEYESGMHGADESLLIEDLVTMTEFNLHAARALCS
jgi:acetylornithine deacetylase/succinyl-diaminopimelate desuccinylase-like protein